MNLRVKSFQRSLQNKLLSDVQMFQVMVKASVKDVVVDLKLDIELDKFNSVFKFQLPHGLAPKRSVNNDIKVRQGSKVTHTHLYQLPPEEEKAAKEYIEDLLKKWKIKKSICSYVRRFSS